jgi:hypothetical protein
MIITNKYRKIEEIKNKQTNKQASSQQKLLIITFLIIEMRN